jgi:hypothetical protein
MIPGLVRSYPAGLFTSLCESFKEFENVRMVSGRVQCYLTVILIIALQKCLGYFAAIQIGKLKYKIEYLELKDVKRIPVITP